VVIRTTFGAVLVLATLIMVIRFCPKYIRSDEEKCAHIICARKHIRDIVQGAESKNVHVVR